MDLYFQFWIICVETVQNSTYAKFWHGMEYYSNIQLRD